MSNEIAKRPNFVVITTDQQRYDSLGITGNSIVQTPNINALARQGVLFSRAYCQNTVCIPSRACLHTGRYTHQHGVQYMENEIDTTPTLPPWEKTFMERLQDAGYQTGAFGKIHMMIPKGYDEVSLTGGKGSRWTQSIGQDIGPAPLGPAYAAWLEQKRPGGYEEIYRQRRQPEYRENRTAIVNVLSEDEYVETWISEESTEFLSRQKQSDSPFLLWAGFCGPHGPFDPPDRFARMYPAREIPLPESYVQSANDRLSPDMLRRVIAHYYGLVSCIDEKVGEIVTTLAENDQLDNTVIVFTSDHGEMLGDRNRFGKGCFYEPVIRIPTIISHPHIRRETGSDLRVHDGLVETFSIAPTLLELAGVDVPLQMAAESLTTLLREEEIQRTEPECILCEHMSNDRSQIEICLRTATHKLVMQFPYGRLGSTETFGELYDMVSDPGETNNRYNESGYIEIRDYLKETALRRILETTTPAYDGWIHRDPPAFGPEITTSESL